MKVIGILLLILGAVGVLISINMFGDIGIAGGIGSVTAMLSGLGFVLSKKNKTNVKEVKE